MKTIFDVYTKDEIEEKLDYIYNLISKKFSDNQILKKIDCEFGSELLSIVKARLRSASEIEKDIGEGVLYYNEEDLRFSTPEIIADFRANKLKCNKIVDLCSGIGIQSGAFSLTCGRVLGVEIDERKVRYSKENFIDKHNLEFFKGDVLDSKVIDLIKKFSPDIIFIDPERLISEEKRELSTIIPDLRLIIKEYSKICPNIAIEVPPRIELEKLSELGNFDAEYLILNNKLNRLDINFGNLKKSKVSCVDVKTDTRLDRNNISIKTVKEPLSYIYEVSEGVIQAGLVNEIGLKINAQILENSEKKILLTSGKFVDTELKCFYNCYRYLYSCNKIEEINKFLLKNRFGKGVVKYPIHPKEYWKERNKIEDKLKGSKEAVIFCLSVKGRREFLICEKI
jgi:16S rRNA G966 N2-methylase RsmD